jgi:multidrug transporter EmrE-like cation transporter
MISGFCFGIAAIFTKVALFQEFSVFSLQSWKILIFSWGFLGLIIFSLLGVIFYWLSLKDERAMIVSPVATSFTILTAVAGGLILFGEQISLVKIFGIGVIIIGTVFLKKW